jgi:hypothetical protein
MGDAKLLEGQKAFAFGSCERSHEMNAQKSVLEGVMSTSRLQCFFKPKLQRRIYSGGSHFNSSLLQVGRC